MEKALNDSINLETEAAVSEANKQGVSRRRTLVK